MPPFPSDLIIMIFLKRNLNDSYKRIKTQMATNMNVNIKKQTNENKITHKIKEEKKDQVSSRIQAWQTSLRSPKPVKNNQPKPISKDYDTLSISSKSSRSTKLSLTSNYSHVPSIVSKAWEGQSAIQLARKYINQHRDQWPDWTIQTNQDVSELINKGTPRFSRGMYINKEIKEIAKQYHREQEKKKVPIMKKRVRMHRAYVPEKNLGKRKL